MKTSLDCSAQVVEMSEDEARAVAGGMHPVAFLLGIVALGVASWNIGMKYAEAGS